MISNFSALDLVILAVLWFFMSAFSNLIWMRFVTMRYLGRALMQWLDGLDNDEEAQATLSKLFLSMFSWAGSAQIRTGNKIKVKNEVSGEVEEIEEVVTPVDLLGRRIGALIFAKVRSGTGGTKAALGRILEEEAATAGGLSPAAIRELNKGRFGPAIMEIAAPHLQEKLSKKLNNTSKGTEDW